MKFRIKNRRVEQRVYGEWIKGFCYHKGSLCLETPTVILRNEEGSLCKKHFAEMQELTRGIVRW